MKYLIILAVLVLLAIERRMMLRVAKRRVPR
jgi:hypothetical protein